MKELPQHAIEIAREYLERYDTLEEQIVQLEHLYPYRDWMSVYRTMDMQLEMSEVWYQVADLLSKRRSNEGDYKRDSEM